MAQGTLDKNAAPKEIRFKKPKTAQYIRFIAVSGFDNQPFCALAEIEPILEGTPAQGAKTEKPGVP